MKNFAILVFGALCYVHGLAQNLSISGGNGHSVMLCGDGSVYTMGNNVNGQLGTGASPAFSIVPIRVLRGDQPVSMNDGIYLKSIRQVDAGSGGHNVALGCDGSVWTWGWNSQGQIGDNTIVNKNLPVQVLTGQQGDPSGYLRNVVQVTAGNESSYALLSDGRVMGWGRNVDGELGNGNNTPSRTPVFVRTSNAPTYLTNVIQIEGGDATGAALKSDGTVWVWGVNNNGQLGQNNTTNLNLATQVFRDAARTQPLDNIISISLGDTHLLALSADGTLWAWGGQWAKQLGINSASNALLPVKVQASASGPDFSGVKSISAGNRHSMAVMNDGTLKTWGAVGGGSTYLGQTGTGSGTEYPTTVPGITNIVEASDGDNWTFAVTSTGAIYAFGENTTNGYLGVNSTAATVPTPTAIPSLPCEVLRPCVDAFLGTDVVLCNPSSTTLYAPSGASTVKYRWKRDGVLLPDTTSSLFVNTAGTYRLIMWDSSYQNGCGYCPPDSDEVIITNASPVIPNNVTFCANPCQSVDLSVTGPGGSNYDWYSSQFGGSALNSTPSSTFTSPCITNSVTYWVEDRSTQRCNAGYGYNTSPLSSPGSATSTNDNTKMVFDVLTSFTLDTITVAYNKIAYGVCSGGVSSTSNLFSIVIKNSGGTTLATITPTVPCGSGVAVVDVPIGYTFPVGTGYRLEFVAGPSSHSYVYFQNGANYATVPECSWINLVGSPTGDTDDWPPFYNWRLRVGSNPCGRTAVQAIKETDEDCSSNPCTASPPSSVSVDQTTYCESTTSQITLSVTGGSGDELVWYSGSCGGTEVGRNSTGADIVVSAPVSATTFFARWEMSGGCSSSCESISVNPVDPPSASLAGTNQNICNIDQIVLSANDPVIGKGNWTVVSGVGTVSDPDSPVSAVSGIGAGDLILDWTIVNSPCPPSSSQVTIHRDTLSAPVINSSGVNFDTCSMTTGVPFSTSIDKSPSVIYNWSVTGGLTVASQNGNSVIVDIGTSGGELTVTETNGSCILSSSQTISVSPDISFPDAGPDRSLCSGNAVQLSAQAPAIGIGQWSGSGGIILNDPNNPLTIVSGLNAGSNILTWTVNGCGGPLSDEVIITIDASSMDLNAYGPEDTACLVTPRVIEAVVTGGSGNYNYYWSSSDNSYTGITSSSSVTIFPSEVYSIYYVYAVDKNTGCVSNADSIVVHSISGQYLTFNNQSYYC